MASSPRLRSGIARFTSSEKATSEGSPLAGVGDTREKSAPKTYVGRQAETGVQFITAAPRSYQRSMLRRQRMDGQNDLTKLTRQPHKERCM